jgi:surfeit locus 1 family protein
VKRIPVIATIVVGLAVAAMIALGVWQVQRRGEKAVLVARFAANLNLPPMAYPELAPVAPEAMFRKAQVRCLRVVHWRSEAGRSAQGRSGYRHIADCVTGAEGPGALVDLGVSSDPAQKVAWTGGTVDGVITTEPNHGSLIGRLFTREAALRPMLVAASPAPGLAASTPPDPSDVPNNHLAYAVQWFVFAGAALLIYALALRRRREK